MDCMKLPRRKKSVLRQALMANSALVVVTLGVLAALFLAQLQNSFEQQLKLRTRGLAEFLVGQTELALLIGDREALQRLAREALSTEDVVYVRMTDGAGTVTEVSRPGFALADAPKLNPQDLHSSRIFHTRRSACSAFEAAGAASANHAVFDWNNQKPDSQQVGTVQVGVCADKQKRALTHLMIDAVVGTLAAVALMILIHHLHLRRLLQPLKTLTAFSKRVGTGDLEHLAPVERTEEAGELALAFNQMVTQLKESRNQLLGLLEETREARRLERESEERFRLIATTIDEVFWMVTPDIAKMLYISPGYEQVWGRTCASLYEDPRSFIEAIPPDERDGFLAAVERRKTGDRFDQEYRIIRPDGAVRWIWDRGVPIRDATGQIISFVGVAQDITDRKHLEGQLSQAHKLESIGQLAAGVAHEINTPIQYVGDNIRFLETAYREVLPLAELGRAIQGATLDDIELDYLQEEVPKAVAQALAGVEQVASIVRAMKEFSHPGSEGKIAVDINRAMESTITVSRNEWKYVAEVRTDFDPCLPQVLCLPGELNQAFLNLIVNAAHAIADVVRDTGRQGTISISTHCNASWAEIRVADTGTGIPEPIRARIFDPFFTTKEVGKGTGQGLAIAHSVVVGKHQGTISFESAMGVGTTFLIRLPLGDAAPV
jgi:PAS domain S-box-containing protein